MGGARFRLSRASYFGVSALLFVVFWFVMIVGPRLDWVNLHVCTAALVFLLSLGPVVDCLRVYSSGRAWFWGMTPTIAAVGTVLFFLGSYAALSIGDRSSTRISLALAVLFGVILLATKLWLLLLADQKPPPSEPES